MVPDGAIGRVRPRHAREISGSPWSVGAETMCRGYTIYAHWREFLGPLGVTRARIQSGWARTERERGVYDWAWLDEIIPDMVEQGVRPWVSLGYGNPVYPGGGDAQVSSPLPQGEEALAAWTRFVRAMVTRYRDQVVGWEIWNEPDHGRFTKPAREYAEFYILTAEAVREVDPKAEMILGAVTAGGMRRYVRDCLEHIREAGKLNLVDLVSYHPYSTNPDAINGQVERMRRQVHAIDPRLRLLQGENGAPSRRQNRFALRNLDWCETSQAKWTLRRMLGDWGHGHDSSIFSIMEMAYGPDRHTDDAERNTKGLLALPGDDLRQPLEDHEKTVARVKPAYHAMQHVTAIFDDRLQPTRALNLRHEGRGRVAAYGFRGPRGQAVATWRADDRDLPWSDRLDADTPRVALTISPVSFTDPVLVDLLSGVVWEIPAEAWRADGESATFDRLPLYDSPLVIIERGLVPMREGTQRDGAHAERIAPAVEREIAAGLFPGAVVLVGTADEILYHEAFGRAQVRPQEAPMRRDSLFDVASITKAVATATAVGICVDRGLIDPDAPMTTYLTDHRGRRADRITLRSLAAHVSGFHSQPAASLEGRLRGDAVFEHMLTRSPRWPTDTRYRYACINSIYLSMIVERVTGEDFEAFCRRNIFEPLRMREATFNRIEPSPRAVGTNHPGLGMNHNRVGPDAGRAVGNAGLFTTAEELANFCQMMLGQGEWKGRRVLSAEVIRDFTSAYRPDRFGARGFLWEVDAEADHRPTRMGPGAYGHGGNTGTSLWIDPEAGIFTLVLTNRSHPDRPPHGSERQKEQYRARARIADAALNALSLYPPDTIIGSRTAALPPRP